MTPRPSLPSTGETARSEDGAWVCRAAMSIAKMVDEYTGRCWNEKGLADFASITERRLKRFIPRSEDVPRKWLEELAYFRVKEIRGSDDVPGFNPCVKAELNKMLQSLAAAPRPDAEYRCVNGHDKCNEIYPGPECPYCERKTTTPTGDVAAKLAEIRRRLILIAKRLESGASLLLAEHEDDQDGLQNPVVIEKTEHAAWARVAESTIASLADLEQENERLRAKNDRMNNGWHDIIMKLSAARAEAEQARGCERKRIGTHLRTVGNELLRDKESDSIDGYVAAVLIDMADVIENNGRVEARALSATTPKGEKSGAR